MALGSKYNAGCEADPPTAAAAAAAAAAPHACDHSEDLGTGNSEYASCLHA